MNTEKIQTLDNYSEVNTSPRAIYLTIKDESIATDALSFLEKILNKDNYDLFSWKEDHDGANFCVAGVLRNLLPVADFNHINRILSDNENILTCETLEYLDEGNVTKENALELEKPDSSWYWPINKRLPRKDYKNPVPIKIAQPDTGISLQENLVDGFDAGECMDFFRPPHQRKGHGVVCWDNQESRDIAHGTSIAGMMIGQSREGLKLHGMTELPGITNQDVVRLVPCRVSHAALLYPEDVSRLAQCINWAIDEGIKVVNISLGTIASKNDQAIVPLKQAIERAYKNGVIVCCASSTIKAGMTWPAIYAMKGWSICCAPSTDNNKPSPDCVWPMFENGYVTIAAPGENMPEASWVGGVCSSRISEVGLSGGSSYSTTFTSALAALWWALNYDTLSKADPGDIVPLFRNTIVKACNRWNGDYPKNYGPGVLNPDEVLRSVRALEDYSLECEGVFKVKVAQGGTYKNVTLYAHHSGSIHVIDPIYVEGKLTLRCEESATISMSGTIICRELEIICRNSASIKSDDLEYYDSCNINISQASTCTLYIAAEGPISGSVGGEILTGSTLQAWIYWRQGKKSVSISKDYWCTVDIKNDWSGRWA